MTDQQQTAIQQQLNELNRLVGGLSTAVTTHTDTWRVMDQAATAGRRRLYERFEAFQKEVLGQLGRLSTRVQSLEEKVKVIKPSVDAFNDEQLRVEGEKRLGLRLWAAMMFVAGLLGWAIHEAVTWWGHLPSGKP